MSPIALGVLQTTRRLITSALLVLPFDPETTTLATFFEALRAYDNDTHLIGDVDDLENYLINHD